MCSRDKGAQIDAGKTSGNATRAEVVLKPQDASAPADATARHEAAHSSVDATSGRPATLDALTARTHLLLADLFQPGSSYRRDEIQKAYAHGGWDGAVNMSMTLDMHAHRLAQIARENPIVSAAVQGARATKT